MLSEFVTANRGDIIARCRARVAARMAPRPTALELEHGIPLFLDQLAAALRLERIDASAIGASATQHGSELLRSGFTIAQVVNDYGDACQAITELAIERGLIISSADFKTLNLCLDDAIASAVTEYGRQRELYVAAEHEERANEDLGFFAHELRNLLGTVTLAFEALRSGSVDVSGSTGDVLGRSLKRLRNLVDRSLTAVRLNAGIGSPERIVVAELMEEVEVSAMMEAKSRGHLLTVQTGEPDAVVEADRQIIVSIITNLLQNAFKYTRPRGHVFFRSSAPGDHVLFEIEDECGGLPPGKAEALFAPFQQHSADRSGLGLGLAICQRGAKAIGGTVRVRDLPGTGCVFTIELPRASKPS